MIQLKSLKIKNFMSVGNNPILIDFEAYDRTLVTGSNGSGKSTLFLESLSYALYGKAFRKLKNGQLINCINNKNCAVNLELYKNNILIKIVRGLKPNVFKIFKNGKLIEQTASVNEYQTILDDIIGLDIGTFKQIIAIGTAGYIPFMLLPSYKRRKMIENLIGIDIFSIIHDLNKSEARETKTNGDLIVNKILSRKREYDVHTAYKKEQDLQTEQQIESQYILIKDTQSLIDDQQIKVNGYIDDNNNLDNIIIQKANTTENATRIWNRMVSLKTTRDSKIKRLSFFEQEDSCPTCTQDISTELKSQSIKSNDSKLKEINAELQTLKEEYKKYHELGKVINKAELDKAANLQEISLVELAMSGNHEMIRLTEERIKELKTPKADSSEIINQLKREIQELGEEKRDNDAEKRARDIIKNTISDTGVKKFIISQYIPLLNSYINKYLQCLGANYVFILDEEFNEEIKSRGRDNFTYSSFSQGERGRIDLSIILAFRKLIESRSNNDAIFNILILDEILDSSLDEAGTKEVNNLLSALSKEHNGTKLFVISHNENNMNSNIFSDHIHLDKIGNYTKMKTV